MDRRYVIDNHIVEKYLNGSLSTPESQSFEEFYLYDQDTLEDLQAAQLLKQGLKNMPEAESYSGVSGPRRMTKMAPKLAASIAVAAGISSFIWLGTELGDRQNEIDALTERLVTLSQPSAGLEPLYLSATRGDSLPRSISLEQNNGQLVFALEVAPPDETRYTVRLVDSSGTELWRAPSVTTNDQGDIIVSVHPVGLSHEQTYQWEVLIDKNSSLVNFQSYGFKLTQKE